MSKEISDGLRKLADELLKKSQENEKSRLVKCAKVLVAAKGLLRFKEVFGGSR